MKRKDLIDMFVLYWKDVVRAISVFCIYSAVLLSIIFAIAEIDDETKIIAKHGVAGTKKELNMKTYGIENIDRKTVIYTIICLTVPSIIGLIISRK